MSYSVEVLREIWDDENGNCIQIGPDRDGLEMVELRGLDRDVQVVERMLFVPAVARLVAQALLACADELEKQENGDDRVHEVP